MMAVIVHRPPWYKVFSPSLYQSYTLKVIKATVVLTFQALIVRSISTSLPIAKTYISHNAKLPYSDDAKNQELLQAPVAGQIKQ